MKKTHEAKYYKKLNGKVHCFLCPHNCKISEGEYGICRVRKNEGGRLIAKVYGKLIARHTDPIEKKPLYHFFPGKNILSVGTVGCNLKCFFCQNCDISQAGAEQYDHIPDTSPDELIRLASIDEGNIGIAYTYNEPSINFEYIADSANKARKKNLRNVMVSNGFISMNALKELIPLIDAFNIDLKAFSNEFYRKYTKSEIKNVKESLIEVGQSPSHLEITFLIIPGLNDNEEEFKEMLRWIDSNFGENQVLHLSRYFPGYRSDIPPTPVSTLKFFREMALEKLNYVFLGNVAEPESQNSYCPDCGKLLIKRGYRVSVELDSHGKCPDCKRKILNYY
ncbi:MAG: AmmeMemoRadiSam system radical SAM enzyme [Bacteroidota bacterium]